MSISPNHIISQDLIYEQVHGQAIFYRGYKDVLDGKKTKEEIMGSSIIQSFLISQIISFLNTKIGEKYYLFTNELGVLFAKNSWRATDIAIVEKANLSKEDFKNHYLQIPPKIVIEIDTKAEFRDFQSSSIYLQVKTEDFLNFGVERVIWIFTDTQKVMVAEKNKKWEIGNWNEEIEVLEGVRMNVSKFLE
jgi:Uma2 family endonuclease